MPYQCTECGRLFREISNLYRHRNSHHAGVGGYNVIRECWICQEKFEDFAALQGHIDSHFEETC